MTHLIKTCSLGLLLGSLVACGGSGSGLDSDKQLGSLTVSEQIELCEWTQDQTSTEPYMCDGMTITPEAHDDCATEVEEDPLAPSCAATVEQFEDCIEALAADLCAESFPPSCGPLFACEG